MSHSVDIKPHGFLCVYACVCVHVCMYVCMVYVVYLRMYARIYMCTCLKCGSQSIYNTYICTYGVCMYTIYTCIHSDCETLHPVVFFMEEVFTIHMSSIYQPQSASVMLFSSCLIHWCLSLYIIGTVYTRTHNRHCILVLLSPSSS